jgi:hypothetical protein
MNAVAPHKLNRIVGEKPFNLETEIGRTRVCPLIKHVWASRRGVTQPMLEKA